MKTRRLYYYGIVALGMYAIMGCKNEKLLVAEEGEQFSGGETTIFNTSTNAFGFIAPNVTGIEELQFFSGNSFFNQSWVSAPASTTARDGLGPLFNAVACSSCHFKDGRGRSPAFSGETGHGLLLRVGMPDPNVYNGVIPDPMYGEQLSDMAVNGADREGAIQIEYNTITGLYNDGTTYTLREPIYSIMDYNYGSPNANLLISPRVANQIIGLGLLEAIDDNDILALADENDLNGDGISGRPNYVTDRATGNTVIGRFGWKANQPNVRQQSAGAFVGDLGITSVLFPNENCSPNQDICNQLPNGNNANGYELDDEILDRIELYVSVLTVPGRRDWENQDVLKEKELFFQANCQACHVQKFTTGIHPKFEALSQQPIYPYTDLLLHDMGEGLADNMPDHLATGREWRTPPLWGIGLFETVNGHTELLHDGRAQNVEEAILWHDGEAASSKQQFIEMSATEREQLIQFVKSL